MAEETKHQEPQQEPQQAEPNQEPAKEEPNPLQQELAGLKDEIKSFKESEAQKSSALQEHINKQQQEAIDFFKDNDKKKALLSTMSAQEADGLLKDIEEGRVTRRELEVRAELGFTKITGPKESTTVPVNKPQHQQVNGGDFNQISNQLMEIQRNPNHPYHDPNNPKHHEAVAQYKALDKKREQLVS